MDLFQFEKDMKTSFIGFLEELKTAVPNSAEWNFYFTFINGYKKYMEGKYEEKHDV